MKPLAFPLAALAFIGTPTFGAVEAQLSAIGYICGAEQTVLRAGALPTVLLTGVGNGGAPADTKNPDAQRWFDQGLNLYHAFNHNEARDAFARAAAADPECAMCEWGVALGLGATLNYGITPAQRAEALTHAERARRLVKPGDAKTAGLVDAMLGRYAKDGSDFDRETAFGKAMDALARRYPDDDSIANLAAEALMIPGRGSNAANAGRAEELVKTVLARKPDDTAAIHYYIHASEFLGRPADALPYAERLSRLAPGASHLVHMGAHTLMHVGEYEEVALVDAQALKVDADVGRQLNYGGPLSTSMYYLHNYNFGLAGALMAGDGRLAVKYADHAKVAFPESGDSLKISTPSGSSRSDSNATRRLTATARGLVAYGRFAPDRALAIPEKPGDPVILRTYRHYVRGEAFAARRDAAAVRREAEALDAIVRDPKSDQQDGTLPIAMIAADVLKGRAALLSNDPAKAAEYFADAAARQDKAFPAARAFDPPPWWYPVRRSLAAAHLKAGRYADAAKEARASLADWPQDALALRVLSQAEARLGQFPAARAHQAEARRNWRGDLRKAPLDLT
jgi:hypothetical protein